MINIFRCGLFHEYVNETQRILNYVLGTLNHYTLLSLHEEISFFLKTTFTNSKLYAETRTLTFLSVVDFMNM